MCPVASLLLTENPRHGFEFRNLARSKALAAMYESLPDKSKVKLKQRVARIHETPDGVVVSTDDGSIERGHIVVGCDGAYSSTRDLMWKVGEEHGAVITDGERNCTTVELGQELLADRSSFPRRVSLLRHHGIRAARA